MTEIQLLVIDDFCDPRGALYVPGEVADVEGQTPKWRAKNPEFRTAPSCRELGH